MSEKIENCLALTPPNSINQTTTMESRYNKVSRRRTPSSASSEFLRSLASSLSKTEFQTAYSIILFSLSGEPTSISGELAELCLESLALFSSCQTPPSAEEPIVIFAGLLLSALLSRCGWLEDSDIDFEIAISLKLVVVVITSEHILRQLQIQNEN
jgi:hypothetical protein